MSILGNIGYDLGLNTGPIRRIVFCLTQTDGGVVNSLTLANAAAIANWRTKFNVYNHAADPSIKFVCSPLVYQGAFPAAEPTKWTVEDYERKMRNAPSDFEFHLLDPSPYILGNFEELESQVISAYFITEDNYAIGKKDGANLVPFPIQNNSLSVPYYSPAGFETGSDNPFKFRLSAGSDRNSLVAVKIADGSVTDSADFIALRDVTGTVSAVTANGCTITTALDDVNPAVPGTPIRLVGLAFGDIVFYDNAAPSTPIALSGAGELVETSGVYVITKSAIFTTEHIYTCKIIKSGYDTVVDPVTFTA